MMPTILVDLCTICFSFPSDIHFAFYCKYSNYVGEIVSEIILGNLNFKNFIGTCKICLPLFLDIYFISL